MNSGLVAIINLKDPIAQPPLTMTMAGIAFSLT
jgi:hypothetical protein